VSYATVAEFKARVDQRIATQLASEDGQSVDDSVIEQALDDAAGVIDGYLAKVAAEHRPADRVLAPYAVDIALYRLARRRPGLDVENIKAGHDEAVRFLARVAEGRLSGTGGDGLSPAGAGSIAAGGPEPAFTRETLEDL